MTLPQPRPPDVAGPDGGAAVGVVSTGGGGVGTAAGCGGGAGGGGGAAGSSGLPHFAQNRVVSSACVPHFGQNRAIVSSRQLAMQGLYNHSVHSQNESPFLRVLALILTTPCAHLPLEFASSRPYHEISATLHSWLPGSTPLLSLLGENFLCRMSAHLDLFRRRGGSRHASRFPDRRAAPCAPLGPFRFARSSPRQ